MKGYRKKLKKWKPFIKFIEGLGFKYNGPVKHGYRWKHPDKHCFVQISGSTGDRNAYAQARTQIKDVLTQQCKPPFDPNDFGEHLKSLRSGLVGNPLNIDMDTLDEVLDGVFAYAENYEESTIHPTLQTKYKNRLKNIAAAKGITMGETIEEMIEVYEKTQ